MALWLFLLGGFLAVYLPMVPFLVWVGAVIGYFLLAIESIIAAPLWAIAFMEPGAQDGPGGKNAQGWYLVMNLFLRPVLLVVSMIAVMLLADVVLRYLNIYMLPTFEMATAADSFVHKIPDIRLDHHHLLRIHDDDHARGVFIDPPYPR